MEIEMLSFTHREQGAEFGFTVNYDLQWDNESFMKPKNKTFFWCALQ